jgi:hypothetical protein
VPIFIVARQPPGIDISQWPLVSYVNDVTLAHTAFQRDTILALQDAMGELWALSADAHNRALTSKRETGSWPPPDPAMLPGLNTVSERATALRARVFDDDLRRLVSELHRGIWHAIEAADWGSRTSG